MGQIINITEKLSSSKPKIVIGEKKYEVNHDIETVLKFEELAVVATGENMVKAIEISMGKEAAKELNVKKMSVPNFKVLTVALLAAMQGISYDEAEKRFLTKL